MKIEVLNSQYLIDLMEKFPSFHDAEIIEITLKRKYKDKFCPTLETLIYFPYFGSKYNIKIRFSGIFGLIIENFNHQNVLSSLDISEFSEEYWNSILEDSRLKGVVSQNQIENLHFHVKFGYCFGVEAEFLCDSVVIDSVEKLS